MRKNTYTKYDGVLPETPFKKGDIITYIDIDKNTGKVNQKNIIILDRINTERHCDIFGQCMLTITHEEAFIDTTPFGCSRVWFNHDKIRPATWFELVQLSHALLQIAPGESTEGLMPVNIPRHNSDE
jgi:hypothetical protein